MTIVSTPAAPHPQAQIIAVNLTTGTIRFNWLAADGQRVDSGNSVAPFAPGEDWPAESDIAGAIVASTA